MTTRKEMNRRAFLTLTGRTALGGLAAGVLPRAGFGAAAPETGGRLPNFVIVFTDDQGYQDVGCFGSPKIKTPNLDRMAAEGMRFTDFYVAQAVCSASRAALMTGCYSNRVGILGALGPKAPIALGRGEMTIAELCKQKNYATGMVGKWHLGDAQQALPVHRGFDEYLGLPYSNDMWPLHPERPGGFPPLPLIDGDKQVKVGLTHEDQCQLTTQYTERAVHFIEKNKDRPFFLYVAQSMPHVPLHVSDKFRGKSERGLYGDVIMEIDWSVGQILEALKRNGLDDNTLVVFTSDNGPWLSYGDHGGCALPLREGKGTAWDGGTREPTIMRWPGRIPAGVICREPVMTIDILPTIAGLIGGKLPDHKIDGLDIWPLMSGRQGAKSPHEALFFYWGRELQGVRMGKWKLHFPHGYRTLGGRPGGTGGIPSKYSDARTDLALFDLENDVAETTDVKDKHPDVVAKIQALAEKMREDLGDSAAKRQGSGCREPERIGGANAPPKKAAGRVKAN